MASSTYSVGRGSASGQYSIVDGNGKTVCYADSKADAEEAARNLCGSGTETIQKASHISTFALFRGYLFEKELGYKGTFRDYEKEIL